jgi:hypothetical protein
MVDWNRQTIEMASEASKELPVKEELLKQTLSFSNQAVIHVRRGGNTHL